MTLTRTKSTFLVTLPLLGILAGCPNTISSEPWSTKNRSLTGSGVEPPRGGEAALVIDDPPAPPVEAPRTEAASPRGSAPPTWSADFGSRPRSVGHNPPPSPPESTEPPRGEVSADVANLRRIAVARLVEAMDDPHPQVRAHAVEAMQWTGAYAEETVRRGLGDPNRGVRFVAAMTAGRLSLRSLLRSLQRLQLDESLSVRAAAIYALRSCGEVVDLNPLASMIHHSDPEVRGNAAMVLAELGNPSAISLIKSALGRDMGLASDGRVKVVNLQLAEAVVQLGDISEIEVIRAALFAPPEQAELTAIACMMCGRLNDQRAIPNLFRLAAPEGQRRQPAEVRMAATWALARLDPSRAPAHVALEYATADAFQLRMQAAMTLGEMNDRSYVQAVAGLLGDPEPLVQVAAAGAIARMTRPSR